jgi:hypothetical protein
MARMMRMTWKLVCVGVVFLGACAWGEGSPNDDPGTRVDAAVQPTNPVCGDGECAPSEIGLCSADCGSGPASPVCGNSVCETGETQASCPADCGAPAPVCGNGVCENGESSATCAADCGGGGGSVTCPADPLECFGCFIDPSLCPPGHDEASCTACIFPI